MRVFAGMAMTEAQLQVLREVFKGFEQAFNMLTMDAPPQEPTALFDLAHFEAWCGMVSIPPCVDALRAYALVQQAPSNAARYGNVVLK